MVKHMRRLARAAGAALVLVLWLGAAKASDLESALAAYDAGDYAAAESAFKDLAAAGDAEAMFRLGVMGAEGKTRIVNDSATAAWFRRAADAGHAEARHRLAQLYEMGRGVPLDLVAAYDWYGKAADQGVVAAKRQRGFMTIQGRGTVADEAAGRAILAEAAAAGDAQAQAYLAPEPEPEPRSSVPAVVANTEGEVVVPAEGASGAARAPALAMPEVEPFIAPPPDPAWSAEATRLYDWIVADAIQRTPPGAVIRYGPVVIVDAGAGFQVTIPDLVFQSYAEGYMLHLGTYVADVTPRDPDVYGVVMTLPPLVTIDDDTGAEVAHVTFGEGTFQGTWAPATGGYLDQTLVLGGIVAASAEAGFEARIDRVRYETALKAEGESRVTGPSAIDIQGITFLDGQGHRIIRVGALRGTSEVRGLDRGILARVQNGMAAMNQMDRGGAAPDLSFLPTEPGAILGGARMDVTFEGVEFALPTGDGFNIARLAYAASVSGLDAPLARFDMQYRHDGLGIAGGGAAALVPDLANIDIAVERLPVAHLYGLALAAGIGALGNPGAGPDALVADLPSIFAQAGTRVEVAAIDLAAAGAEAHASGTFAGDPAASGGVVGSFTMFASGLEGAIARLQGDPNDMDAQQAGFFLALLQSLGAPETSESGGQVLAYRVQLSPDGRHTLNGQDIDALMNGMMGAP